jgi:hypothetical protein
MALIGNYTPDDLIAGDFPIVKEVIVVPSGTAAFARGTILDADGVPIRYAEDADGVPVKGAADADCVALEAVDASQADAPCIVALTGQFNQNKIAAPGVPVDALKTALRAKSIFLEKGL